MALTKAKVSFVEGVDGAVLTGAMPAVDGSSLTGISGMTKVTSDPALNTNPSSGVGTTWVNKSSGEMFVCTDATAGENVWVNVGGGVGHVTSWHGKQHGYVAGGGGGTNGLQRFAFASGTQDAEDIGDMTGTRYQGGAWSSLTHGYYVGGFKGGPKTDALEKFTFAAASSSTDIGNLTATRVYPGGYHDALNAVGYICGGSEDGVKFLTQEKYSFDSSVNAFVTSSLTIQREAPATTQSATNGYAIGGHILNTTPQNSIEKTSFASDTVSTYSGTLINASGTSIVVRHPTAVASLTHFYVVGGYANLIAHKDDIQKFSFSSESSGTDIANLTSGNKTNAGSSSSTTAGYVPGGEGSSASASIDRINFATDTTIVDSGDLIPATGQSGGVRGFQV